MKYIFRIVLPLAAVAAMILPATAANPASTPKNQVEIPDMDLIKQEVTNPDSKYYYPKLMSQYLENETIMNVVDYRYLYLGTVFQEDYNPYRRNKLDNILDRLYYQENHSRAELDSIMQYAKEALEDDPFDLSQINFYIYALRKRGKNNLANIWQYRLNHLLQAILSTGTGVDRQSAWIVIDPKHEYNIINFQNSVVDSVEFVGPYYDHVIATVDKDKKEKTTEYYFNIRYILQEYYRKHPEEAN